MVAVGVDEIALGALCQGRCVVSETIGRGAKTMYLGPRSTWLNSENNRLRRLMRLWSPIFRHV